MTSSSPAEIRLPSPSPEFLDRYSAESRLIANGPREALCVSEAFVGTRCSAPYVLGRLEACRSLSGDDLLKAGYFGRSELPTDGIVVWLASPNNRDSYAFAMK